MPQQEQPITPGAPKQVDFILADYTDPLAAAPAPGHTVRGRLSDSSSGPALDPGCDYAAVEIGAAAAPYVGTVYRFTITAASTATPLAGRVGSRIYLCPVVDGNPVDAGDVVPLRVVL